MSLKEEPAYFTNLGSDQFLDDFTIFVDTGAEAGTDAGETADFIDNIRKFDRSFEDMRRQAELNHKHIRFVAKLENGKVSTGLQEVGEEHPFYSLEDSNNVILITTERYKEYPMEIKGYGAGAEVTAAGVFADIISIANIR